MESGDRSEELNRRSRGVGTRPNKFADIDAGATAAAVLILVSAGGFPKMATAGVGLTDTCSAKNSQKSAKTVGAGGTEGLQFQRF